MAKARSKQEHLVPKSRKQAKVAAKGAANSRKLAKAAPKVTVQVERKHRPDGPVSGVETNLPSTPFLGERVATQIRHGKSRQPLAGPTRLEAEVAESERSAETLEARRLTKVHHPTLVVVKYADGNQSLDVAVVFVKAGSSTSDAVQAGADAGIEDAVEDGSFELPDDFDADDHGLRWDAAYVG